MIDQAGVYSVYSAAEREMATALGVDVGNLSASDKVTLATATALRIERDRFEKAARSGETFDPAALVRSGQALAEIIEAAAPAATHVDLTKYSDDELTLLERCRSVLEGHDDPGGQKPLAEANARTKRVLAAHAKTLEAERLCSERSREVETLRARIEKLVGDVEALKKYVKDANELLGLYRKLAPQVAAAAEVKP